MMDKKFEEYIDNRQSDIIVNKNCAEKQYDILMKYIFTNFDFVKESKKRVFHEYFYSFILEDLGYKREDKGHSPEFEKTYLNIKDRIYNLSLDELRYKEVADYDYENEALVIAFRILKYFKLENEKLFLKTDKKDAPSVRVYNDYRSNVYMCVILKENVDYASLKLIEEKIHLLRKEIEYLNDFVLNYYQDQYLRIFRISKVIFDKKDFQDRFIQGEVRFKASFKIIQKLIGPLYLNKQSYGMRELLQNSVDACLKDQQRRGYIEIAYCSEKKPCIKIKDNGIGMNEEIILNKFLTIGESSKEDAESIGKFGIGILAAFLLADKMRFKTCFNGENYIYESEEIELKAVQNEESFINIKKYKNEQDFIGTEIVLFLKDSIFKSEQLIKIRNENEKDLDNKIRELFGINNIYGSLWYGHPDELQKIRTEIPELIDIYEKYDTFQKDGENLEMIKLIVEKIFKIYENEKTLIHNFKSKVKKYCEETLIYVDKKQHLAAFSIFEYLFANKWYLSTDDSLSIKFFDNTEELINLKNFSIESIKINDTIAGNMENILTEGKVNFFWSDEYDGYVFCNSMLIPSKYQFTTPLSKIFRRLPTILVNESKKQKLKIDLAREKCKLVMGDFDFEEDIMKEITKRCLENLKESENYLEKISWLYFKNEYGELKKVVKNSKWILANAEKEYCFVFLDYQKEECISENDKIKIINTLNHDLGNNIIIEFIDDNLRIDTVRAEVEFNDLYKAAIYGMKIILQKEIYEKIRQFSRNHLKALALAAQNISGQVCVAINNQLMLNNDELRDYKQDCIYVKKFEEQCRDVGYLNYNDSSSDALIKKLPPNVNAVMMKNMKERNNIFDLFKDIANSLYKKRECVWNGFQEGIHQMELSENDELLKILMKEYAVTFDESYQEE
ncbi:MAG: hypothetical protein HDR04_16845 [Lachnospiraceae bacterium]|nr:hypothetical protein [Lachnospiraceae bacterium]